MRLRLVLMALGVVLAAGGLLIASRPIRFGGGDICTVDMGCRTTNPIEVPSLGLGMFVFVLGLVTLVYGYRKEEGSET